MGKVTYVNFNKESLEVELIDTYIKELQLTKKHLVDNQEYLTELTNSVKRLNEELLRMIKEENNDN